MKYFYIYLLIINLLAIFVTCYDKYCATKNMWRIKEKHLFLIAIFGGSPAMYITMRIIRHKTKHNSFMFGLPTIFLFQSIVYFYVVNNYVK